MMIFQTLDPGHQIPSYHKSFILGLIELKVER